VLCTSISLVYEKNWLTTIIGLRTVNMSKILLTQEHIYFLSQEIVGVRPRICTVIKPKCLSSAFVGNRRGGGRGDVKILKNFTEYGLNFTLNNERRQGITYVHMYICKCNSRSWKSMFATKTRFTILHDAIHSLQSCMLLLFLQSCMMLYYLSILHDAILSLQSCMMPLSSQSCVMLYCHYSSCCMIIHSVERVLIESHATSSSLVLAPTPPTPPPQSSVS
jgi:hypothetical protein